MFICEMWWFYFFLSFANLICRGTGISKYYRELPGHRDNESRLPACFFILILFRNIGCFQSEETFKIVSDPFSKASNAKRKDFALEGSKIFLF